MPSKAAQCIVKNAKYVVVVCPQERSNIPGLHDQKHTTSSTYSFYVSQKKSQKRYNLSSKHP